MFPLCISYTLQYILQVLLRMLFACLGKACIRINYKSLYFKSTNSKIMRKRKLNILLLFLVVASLYLVYKLDERWTSSSEYASFPLVDNFFNVVVSTLQTISYITLESLSHTEIYKFADAKSNKHWRFNDIFKAFASMFVINMRTQT